MGGEGSGEGGTAQFGEVDVGARPEAVRGEIDPRGRISVTTFRGLPRPGEVTKEFRADLERARAEAEAPLSSEQIPRRYRDGIRRYFEELGKSK